MSQPPRTLARPRPAPASEHSQTRPASTTSSVSRFSTRALKFSSGKPTTAIIGKSAAVSTTASSSNGKPSSSTFRLILQRQLPLPSSSKTTTTPSDSPPPLSALDKGKGREIDLTTEDDSDGDSSRKASDDEPSVRITRARGPVDSPGPEVRDHGTNPHKSSYKYVLWREEEDKIFWTLVEGYEDEIDFEALAADLAELVPLANGVRRTPEACKTRWKNKKRSLPRFVSFADSNCSLDPSADPKGRKAPNYTAHEDEVLLKVAATSSGKFKWDAVAASLRQFAPLDSVHEPRTAASCQTRWGNLYRMRPRYDPEIKRPLPARQAHLVAASSNYYARDASSWSVQDTQHLITMVQLRKNVYAVDEDLNDKFWNGVGAKSTPERSGADCRGQYLKATSTAVLARAPSRAASLAEEPSTPRPVPVEHPLAPRPGSTDRSLLVSVEVQPFSANDKQQMKLLHDKNPGQYKLIARALNPLRHKRDVEAFLTASLVASSSRLSPASVPPTTRKRARSASPHQQCQTASTSLLTTEQESVTGAESDATCCEPDAMDVKPTKKRLIESESRFSTTSIKVEDVVERTDMSSSQPSHVIAFFSNSSVASASTTNSLPSSHQTTTSLTLAMRVFVDNLTLPQTLRTATEKAFDEEGIYCPSLLIGKSASWIQEALRVKLGVALAIERAVGRLEGQ